MNSNAPQTPEKWEAELDRALKNLPERQAPTTLLPSVMAQVHARTAKRRHQRSWWQWPVWLRVASAVLLIAITAALPLICGHFWETIVSPELSRWAGICGTVASSLVGATEAAFGVRHGLGQETFRIMSLCAGLLLLVMYFTGVGVGTVVYRTIRRYFYEINPS